MDYLLIELPLGVLFALFLALPFEAYMKRDWEVCDNCATYLAKNKVIWCGSYSFCSSACRDDYRRRHKDDRFFGVRPARDCLGKDT